MADREGVATPNQRQGQNPTKSTTEPTIAATYSRSSWITTAFTHKLAKF